MTRYIIVTLADRLINWAPTRVYLIYIYIYIRFPRFPIYIIRIRFFLFEIRPSPPSWVELAKRICIPFSYFFLLKKRKELTK